MEIAALIIVSLSELQTIDKKYTEEWANENQEELEVILKGLGMNTNQSYEKQECTRRNRFGNVITCSRWVGNELITKEWVQSGNASQEAKDKACGSKLLLDLYRLRGAVQ